MKRIFSLIIGLLLLCGLAAGQGAYTSPFLTAGSGLTLNYGTGTIFQGGAVVSITGATLTMAASQNSCAAPTYSACNFVYWTSGTSLSTTTTLATANAAGNVIVGFVTTTGSAISVITHATAVNPQPPGMIQTGTLLGLPSGGILSWNADTGVSRGASDFVVAGNGTAGDSSAYFAADGNVVALTADWTCGTGGTVSSCASAQIIGSGGGVPLTFTLPLVARSWTWECDGVVGQATAATSNQWNVLTATNGATNVTANYAMATAATAAAFGAVTDTASTTTTFQISPNWTLGGTATKMPFHIWGRVEGASASGTVLSLQLLAPTVADLVTIYRGTSCRVR